MTPPLTPRDRLYLVVSVAMILSGLAMFFRLKPSWNMALAWVVAAGFVGVGVHRLWIAWKAMSKR
jgi:hypothetical protein